MYILNIMSSHHRLSKVLLLFLFLLVMVVVAVVGQLFIFYY